MQQDGFSTFEGGMDVTNENLIDSEISILYFNHESGWDMRNWEFRV